MRLDGSTRPQKPMPGAQGGSASDGRGAVDEREAAAPSVFSRRNVLILAAAAAGLSAIDALAATSGEGPLVWTSKADILGRAREAGGSAATGKNLTYPVRFVAYLARILLNYDAGSKQLWDLQVRKIPLSYDATKVAEVRRKQFAEFAEAVEVGLTDYQGATGVRALLSLLRSRYGTTPDRQKQLAILFSFAPGEVQPTAQMQQLLGQVDDARLSSVDLTERGGGYTGRVPRVYVSPPPVKDGRKAEVRAVLRDTGRIARLELPPPGTPACIQRYKEQPEVRISPPSDPSGEQAEARALIDSVGRLVGLKLVNPGSGYSESPSPVVVEVFGQGEGSDNVMDEFCDSVPQIRAVLDKEVSFLDIVHAGSGYATALPLPITIESPQSCGGEADGQSASAIAYLSRRTTRVEPNTLSLPGTSLSSQLTQLLPSDVVDTLVFDPEGHASILGLETEEEESEEGAVRGLPVTTKKPQPFSTAFDPVFGPIGRSPVQQEAALTPNEYLRLALSGALCNSLVRTALHPVDTVKTRMQAEPTLGRGAAEAFQRLNEQGGLQVFKGIDVSAILGFLLGFFGFGCNELFRRALEGSLGPEDSMALQVPIILAASGGAQLVNSIITCPWEGVRIRVMTAPGNFAIGNFITEFQNVFTMYGPAALVGGLGPLLFREVPFAVTKFLVFELARDAVYSALPATQEGVFSSLVVSLVCGMAGGVAAAIVSNPADAILTRLNAPAPVAATGLSAVANNAVATSSKLLRNTGNQARRASDAAISATPMVLATAASVGRTRRALLGRGEGLKGGSGGSRAVTGTIAAEPLSASLRLPAFKPRPQPAGSPRIRGEALLYQQSNMFKNRAHAYYAYNSDGASGGDSSSSEAAELGAVPMEPKQEGKDWRAEIKAMQREPGGLLNLFSGIGVRCVFFGALIAIQFFAYDTFKALLGVSPDDLKLVLDVFADRLAFYEQGPPGG